jgi:acyl-CoA synthetase (AMP-forming)/AMP-acid ligase II
MGALDQNVKAAGDCRGLLPLIPAVEDRTAVFAASGEPLWTRAQLRAEVASVAAELSAPNVALVFLIGKTEPEALVALLAAMEARRPVALIDPATHPAALDHLIAVYAPEAIIAPPDIATRLAPHVGGESRDLGGLTLLKSARSGGVAPHADLAVLLSTSGTTGSPKFVRLSAANVLANADQIIAALHIGADDVAVAHLPLHYSYGLSVLTSHLRAGAAAHLWPDSVTIPEFWAAVRASGGTHFPGVPFHYNFLGRADLSKMLPPALRTFTQAGGALDVRIQKRMDEQLRAIGGRFYVMYGQTEAAPRITTLPAERLAAKLGSVGLALAGGKLSILGEGDRPVAAGEPGQVVYEGPNVMMGYAEARTDLASGDETGGRLATGDLGRLDEEGFLFLTGRLKRFAKLFGLRISLDEVEARFRAAGDVAALDAKDKIALFTPVPEAISALVSEVAGEYKLPPNSFSVRAIAELPRKSSGKVDYASLEAPQ